MLHEGLQIAISGMLIVIIALLLISLFIAVLPKLLERLSQIWPESESHHAHESHESHPESLRPDDDVVLAAIGFVLHTEFQRQLNTDVKSG